VSRRRLVGLLSITLLALAAITPVAQAAVPVGTSGKIGPFVITDRLDRPGVTCTYDAGGPNDMGNDLDIMDARGPRVFARDRSTRRDRQQVSVKYLFQRSRLEGGTGGWVTAKATKPLKKLAYDDQAARFPLKSWLNPLEPDYHFRTLVIIRWHKPGTGEIQGKTRQRYQFYQVVWSGPLSVEQDRCLPEP
jgi:hypothetical protein